jgi:hypothetical protein
MHLPTLLTLLLAVLTTTAQAADSKPPQDGSQKAPAVIFDPGPYYADEARMFQGIPGLERSPGGRLWVTWYGGGVTEDHFNYIMLITSGDDGATWSGLKTVIDPDVDGPCRAFDPCPWLDPDGQLWLFWAQRDRDVHLWAMTTDNPDDENPTWSPPKLICPGIMMCKPTVLSTGEWLLPVAHWKADGSASVVSSQDRGKTWKTIGRATVPIAKERNCDEHMIVERADGSLWMLIRTAYGIGECVSTDRGRAWSDAVKSKIAHATARFFIRRLNSGNLLLVKHGPVDERTDRSRLTAYLSEDDGLSWKGGLMIDARRGVSYPDGVESPDGTIYLVYDYSRTAAKQIFVATFTEQDIIEGRPTSDKARLQIEANQATGTRPAPRLNFNPNDDGQELSVDPSAELQLVEGKTATLSPGVVLFSDRGYTLLDVPKPLKSKRFVHGSMDRIKATCTKPGMVCIITPLKSRNNDTLEPELTAQGYKKADLDEFLLFGTTSGNVCSVFQKHVEAGEQIEFGKWGILVY